MTIDHWRARSANDLDHLGVYTAISRLFAPLFTGEMFSIRSSGDRQGRYEDGLLHDRSEMQNAI